MNRASPRAPDRAPMPLSPLRGSTKNCAQSPGLTPRAVRCRPSGAHPRPVHVCPVNVECARVRVHTRVRARKEVVR